MTSAPHDLDAAADELYALSPQDFIARRDELSRAARAAGDRDLAKAVKELRRPTVAAWLVNLLVWDGVRELGELLDVGEQLREAQSQLAGARMKELTATRQVLEGELMSQAKSAAAERNQTVTPAVLAEVEATLRAAQADPMAADAVASGRLTRALSYAGLGEVDVSEATATPPPARAAAVAKEKPPAKEKRAREKTAAQEKGTAAMEPPAPTLSSDELAGRRQAKLVEEREQALADVRQRAKEADARLVAAREDEERLRALVDELQRRLKEARDELSDATREAASAQRESERARRGVAAAERELAKARDDR